MQSEGNNISQAKMNKPVLSSSENVSTLTQKNVQVFCIL